eukprot:CAMPEP_0171888846 /NCGR_PEP_ID=MMETSP0992-20121227/43250_1 /TAXON_ID=483369 /ORGANISM="non described non described, Strain CCMP2098" /LENGTH=663 /DNA_ID=CAMNT_0012515795 /DNA_START=179 /DNA_END=2171 /DNA_ORIENTATION=+
MSCETFTQNNHASEPHICVCGKTRSQHSSGEVGANRAAGIERKRAWMAAQMPPPPPSSLPEAMFASTNAAPSPYDAAASCIAVLYRYNRKFGSPMHSIDFSVPGEVFLPLDASTDAFKRDLGCVGFGDAIRSSVRGKSALLTERVEAFLQGASGAAERCGYSSWAESLRSRSSATELAPSQPLPPPPVPSARAHMAPSPPPPSSTPATIHTYSNAAPSATPQCDCDKFAVVRTSKTAKNYDRAFFTCGQFPKCRFFEWRDTHGLRADSLSEAFHVDVTIDHNSVRLDLSVATDPSWIVVTFPYNVDVVAVLKRLHPSQRTWQARERLWLIKLASANEFLQAILDDESMWLIKLASADEFLQAILDDESIASCKPSPNIGALLHLSKQAETAAAKEAAARLIPFAAPASVAAAEAITQPRRPTAPALSDLSREKISKSFIVGEKCQLCPGKKISNWKVRETHAAGSAHQAALSSWIDAHPAEVARRSAPTEALAAVALQARDCGPSPPKRQATDARGLECPTCERRRDVDSNGEHVCRLFGRFVCCTAGCRGKAWTSAYVWRHSERTPPVCEKQGCRTCGQEAEPASGSRARASGSVAVSTAGTTLRTAVGARSSDATAARCPADDMPVDAHCTYTAPPRDVRDSLSIQLPCGGSEIRCSDFLV